MAATTRITSAAITGLAALLVIGCGEGRPDERPARTSAEGPAQPDVLIVTIDTLRADHLGCYGYFRDTSPNLDDLAAESLVFDRCLVPVAQTLPTHTTLFTGLYPYEHGILGNRSLNRVFVPSPKVRLFAEAMAEAGYDTAAFVAAEPVKRVGGLGPGFDSWWEPEDKRALAEVVIDQAIDWLEKPRFRPVFLWVHLFDAHGPYEPPAPYDGMFQSDDEHAARLAKLGMSPRDDRYSTPVAINLYDGEIRYVDDQLGRLFDHFREREEWDELVTVVTSDHGEGLMQHGCRAHEYVWLEQMRVPFLLKVPGLDPGREDVLLGTRDIVPTMLGRVPALASFLGPWLEQVTGRDALGAEERSVFSQYPSPRTPMTHAITKGKWRLMVGEEGIRLFDLELDPHELEDVAAAHPDVVTELGAVVAAELQEQRALGERLGAGRTKELSDQRRRGLEALGYGGDEDD